MTKLIVGSIRDNPKDYDDLFKDNYRNLLA